MGYLEPKRRFFPDLGDSLKERAVAEMPTGDDWSRVGRAIRDRMTQLSMTRVEVMRGADLSRETLDGYIAGKARTKYREDKLRDLSVTLGWVPNALEQLLLYGVAPEDAHNNNGTDPDDRDWLERKLDELAERVSQIEEFVARLEAALPQVEPPPPSVDG